MSIAFQAFHITRKHVGSKQGYLSLPFYWLGFEYLHNHWEFAHPWLSLGNTFSERVGWIQWYEYTGVTGGSLWVIIVNLIGYIIYRNWKQKKSLKRSIFVYAASIISPIAVSLSIKISFNDLGHGHLARPEGGRTTSMIACCSAVGLPVTNLLGSALTWELGSIKP